MRRDCQWGPSQRITIAWRPQDWHFEIILEGTAMRAGVVWLTLAVLAMNGIGVAWCAEHDALALVGALMEAERRTDLDGAMALFTDDAVITNATGWRLTKRDELRWFINTEIWLRDSFDLNEVEAHGNWVRWIEMASGAFYRDIDVAPVRYAFEADVKNGRLTSIVSYIPSQEIKRIAAACKAAKVTPRIHDRPCAEFVKLIEAHTNGINAHAKPGADALGDHD
jgi:ketosteroid isomerase-like protein